MLIILILCIVSPQSHVQAVTMSEAFITDSRHILSEGSMIPRRSLALEVSQRFFIISVISLIIEILSVGLPKIYDLQL